MDPDQLQEIANNFRASLSRLESVISAFTDKVNTVVDDFNDLNNKALSINRSYTDVAGRGVAATEGLNLTLNSKFSIGLELNRQALFGNNRELIKLAAAQEALGKSSAPTIAAFRELQVALRLSESQTNALAKATLDSALRYGISTEVLVDQLQKLQPVMETLSLAGQDTSQFASFVSQLTAKLGGERNADNVARALTILTDVSSKNQNMLARFGVQDLSRRLISGQGSPEEQSALAIEAIRRFSLGVQSMQGSQIENIRLLQEMTGGSAGLFLSLNTELERTANNIKENDPTKAFDQVINNFKNLIDSLFAPIEQSVMSAVKVLIDGVTPVVKFISQLIKSITSLSHFTDLLIIGFIITSTIVAALLIPIIIALVEALAVLLSPILPLIAGMILLGAAVYALMDIFDFGFSDIFNFVSEIFTSIFEYVSQFTEFISPLVTGIKFLLAAILIPVIINLTLAFVSFLISLSLVLIPLFALGYAIRYLLRIFNIEVPELSSIFSTVKKVFNNFGDYMMLIVYRLAQGFYKILSSITFGDLSKGFEKDSLEYKIKADELSRDLQTRAVEAAEKTEENTRKEIKIPEFITTTNKELEDAFRVMLGLQSTNPVASQMVMLNERMEILVDNSNVQTENSTQTVQAQNQTVQRLDSVNQSVKQKPLQRSFNSSRSF